MKNIILAIVWSLFAANAQAQIVIDLDALPIDPQIIEAASKFEPDVLNVEAIINDRIPVAFKPFVRADFCKQKDVVICSEFLTPQEIAEMAKISLEGQAASLYNGTLDQFIAKMNEIEEDFNQRGQSLRSEVESFDYSRLPVDVSRIRKEILSSFGQVSDLLPKVKDPLLGDDCPMLPVDKIDEIPELVQNKAEKQIKKLRALSLQVNQAQSALCAIGYSITDLGQYFDTSKEEAWFKKLTETAEEQDSLLEKLGLSKYAEMFNKVDVEELKAYADIAKDIYAIVQKGEFPGPEQIEGLRNKLNAQLPEEYNIPAFPQIDAPRLPVRTDLAVKKKKVWDKLKFGNPSQLSVGASAWMEIRGNSKEQTFAAQGQVTTSVFGNSISYLNAQGYAEIGPKGAKSKLSAYMLGKAIFPPIDSSKSTKGIDFKGGDTYKPKIIPPYKQQFAIGPIPAYVEIRSDFELYYRYYLAGDLLTLHGGVTPGGSGGVTGALAMGVSGVLSVGVEGNVKVIDVSFPLTGRADITFTESGHPQVTVDLNAESRYDYLSGRINAFVEYPDPGKLFFRSKKANHEIYKFGGNSLKTHKIMNYKMVFGPKGAKVTGDLIDNKDMEEAEAMEQVIFLDNRREAVAKLEAATAKEINESWKFIQDDINGDDNSKLLTMSASVPLFEDQREQNFHSLIDSITKAAAQ